MHSAENDLIFPAAKAVGDGHARAYGQADKEIDQHVQAVKKMLKKQERDDPKDFSPVFIATGDTLVVGYRYNDSKRINVCRNYYELGYTFKE